jgi:selenocysteine-specific elongation factor
MYVIGTAGHVDHGKSALVEALTGIHPDRLKEERERQMTIDLGFAWLTLPAGASVGVIDVPGHRDFIENMLAGVGGIDAALFVVAADEGVMPQTREHLAILDLLAIPAGVVAITKADLVDDEWLELVQADVAEVLHHTVLESAPIIPVSSRTGAGVDDLLQGLQGVLSGRPPRPDTGQPRLPVDRVFSLPGFGTIVTGTLSGGVLTTGDEIILLPDGLPARVRGLQTHKLRVDQAIPGSRVAVNLAGVELAQVRRGMVVARPGSLHGTTHIDARLTHLPGDSLPVKHNSTAKFYVGAAETTAVIRLLEQDTLPPGTSGWAQLSMAEPVVVVKGDRFVLRRPSPGETIGGGVVLDPHPRRRYRRRDAGVVARMQTLERGTPGEILLQALETHGPLSVAAALEKAGIAGDEAVEAAAELRRAGQLVELDDERLVVSLPTWNRNVRALEDILATYHSAHSLRTGMPREELKSRFVQQQGDAGRAWWTPKRFNALLAKASSVGLITGSGSLVRLSSHDVAFSGAESAKVAALLAEFERDPHNTPSYKECEQRLGDELLSALLEQGQLVQLSSEVLYTSEHYRQSIEQVKRLLHERGKATVADVRDMFGTSRKYALALMEHMDSQGITQRVGDERVLRN